MPSPSASGKKKKNKGGSKSSTSSSASLGSVPVDRIAEVPKEVDEEAEEEEHDDVLQFLKIEEEKPASEAVIWSSQVLKPSLTVLGENVFSHSINSDDLEAEKARVLIMQTVCNESNFPTEDFEHAREVYRQFISEAAGNHNLSPDLFVQSVFSKLQPVDERAKTISEEAIGKITLQLQSLSTMNQKIVAFADSLKSTEFGPEQMSKLIALVKEAHAQSTSPIFLCLLSEVWSVELQVYIH